MPKIIASLYEITCLLGSGGSGTVYLGRHLRLNKSVVLKANNNMTMVKREADTLKVLSHVYIPKIYDLVIEDGISYTIMDYIEGESLDKSLKRGERFSSQQIVKWAKQVLEALVYLHSRPPYGILHSDIKPANIMLTPQGEIRLIDFNIALAMGEAGVSAIGQSQGYASPEHYGLDHSADNTSRRISAYSKTKTDLDIETDITPDIQKAIVLDARSDIYGLGATLYHLLTGRLPARNAVEVTPLTAQDCPPGLAVIINKAMSPDKSLRYQTAEDMLSAFDNIRKNDPRARRHRKLRSAVIVVLAIFISIGFLASLIGLIHVNWDNMVNSYYNITHNIKPLVAAIFPLSI